MVIKRLFPLLLAQEMRLTLQRAKGAYRTREGALGMTFGLSSGGGGGGVGGGEGDGDEDGVKEGSSESEEGGGAVPDAEEVAEVRAHEGLGSKKEF